MFSSVSPNLANSVLQVLQILVLQSVTNTFLYTFMFVSRGSQSVFDSILFSTAESSSLCDPEGISTGKTALVQAGDMRTISLELPELCHHPQLRQGEQLQARR